MNLLKDIDSSRSQGMVPNYLSAMGDADAAVEADLRGEQSPVLIAPHIAWMPDHRPAKLPLLIGLAGRAGSGKTATANFIRAAIGQTNSRVASFAKALKIEVDDCVIGLSFPPPGAPPELAQLERGEVFKKPTSDRARRVLQWWGTEYRRGQDPCHWLKSIDLSPDGVVIVHDVRFPNEAEFLRLLGGFLLQITGRSDESVPAHASEETKWLAGQVDGVLYNTGSLKDLQQLTQSFVRSYDAAPAAGESNG
jgi:hypothetical protein